ncbi:MAG TPA: phosphoglucomutase/phosphomannomutase family protein [Bacillota bacterium]|jgi:alpha-D-glucose phosphate-specific phosphoglucomutase|nr:phosphoglucomutase/phosphomannomutase family protein [Peptococcaceae bacterium MAG4]NLW37499.1 phosphoglucomutase/phosphomannomutase family protein [Peptococcaceae bacterium]HPZ43189.1 phosphoglucomutase/phosphomannomutase family protein [Bacillota bacterium]HQD75710.1 phosphoglucomutase/phosphomannomutase family protein [Bacillota bacterium]HUM58566.1 phosphoglucomutase/phosphomannomutase family protein [Bacillota bacterium]
MKKKISFGTDGWRGILAEDFTFDNVRLVTRALARYLHSHGLAKRGVVVGYDNRFLSERFAEVITGVLTGQGIPVFLTGRPTPTPVVAFAVRLHKAGGAVMLTASHNPPEYNGFKFIPEYAGPALPHITEEIEKTIKSLLKGPDTQEPAAGAPAGSLVTTIDPFPEYARHLATLVDLEAIGKAGLKVAVDPMFGAGSGYLENLFEQAGASVEAIHNHRDPLFGGSLPEPTAKSLGELQEMVVKGGLDLGLAMDGDADRFGIVDSNGEFITPNQYLPVLFYHLLKARGMRGPVARTVATTHQLDMIADRYGLEVDETPVGFKYIGQCLMEKGAVLGGEESGGLSIKGHIPEKDGLLAGLLAAELVAVYGTSLTELLDRVGGEFGRVYSRRLDVRTSYAEKERVLGLLKDFAPGTLGGRKVTGRNTLDGVKLLLEGGAWVLIRPSGTESLFRIYVEAASLEDVQSIQKEAVKALGLQPGTAKT